MRRMRKWRKRREEEEEEDEEEFDEKKIRCKGALLAMQVGKFLAEKSEFEQAEEMLMLAYDRIIDVSIWNRNNSSFQN